MRSNKKNLYAVFCLRNLCTMTAKRLAEINCSSLPRINSCEGLDKNEKSSCNHDRRNFRCPTGISEMSCDAGNAHLGFLNLKRKSTMNIVVAKDDLVTRAIITPCIAMQNLKRNEEKNLTNVIPMLVFLLQSIQPAPVTPMLPRIPAGLNLRSKEYKIYWKLKIPQINDFWPIIATISSSHVKVPAIGDRMVGSWRLTIGPRG